jgi:hypothetical protein
MSNRRQFFVTMLKPAMLTGLDAAAPGPVRRRGPGTDFPRGNSPRRRCVTQAYTGTGITGVSGSVSI